MVLPLCELQFHARLAILNKDTGLREQSFEQRLIALHRQSVEWGIRLCPLWSAASTDRRNTSVKSLCWGFKLQGLAWSLVELTRHFVEMSLRVHRQVGALRKVLPQ